MALLTRVYRWFGWGSLALSNRSGEQHALPGTLLVEDNKAPVGVDGALQIAAVWACLDLLSKTVGTLPLFVYLNRANGMRELARDTSLWGLLHDSPNARMTSADFWCAMVLYLALRGNAYARIERDARGEAFALWPMNPDQVQMQVSASGEVIYWYRIDNDLAALAEANVLHIRGMGNGLMGLSKLEYMRASTGEIANAQDAASKLFANGGKPTGVLMVDNILSKEQRAAIQANFSEMACGTTSRLFVLEANMKYQQLNLSPQDMQILETRRYGVEEIGRWFGVPAVLINHSNVTTWGTGIEQIVEGFFKFTIRPLLVSIEKSVAKRVLTSEQRSRYTVEWNFDALLRASLKDRAEIYSKLGQNGVMTRNEMRQLENLPSVPGANDLTVQINLTPLDILREVAGRENQPQIKEQTPFFEASKALLEQKSADDRDQKLLREVRAIIERVRPPAAAPVTINNHMPDVTPTVNNHVKAAEPAPAPVVNVINQVNPTPVNVDVTNEVNPTPVDVQANFEATVQAGEVRVELPPRKTTTEVTRDKDGNIVRATQLESDV